MGRSLGGAVAIHTLAKMAKQSNPSTLDKIAGEDDCYFRGLIIENTFSSISDMADTLFGFLKWIPNIKAKMLKLNWNSEEQIEHVTVPILFVSGSADQLVPTQMTFRLSNAATRTAFKETWIVPGGQHNNTFLLAGPLYPTKLREFMNKCTVKDTKTTKNEKKTHK